MTPAEHEQRIREIAFKLEKADYGMGMPRDYRRVLELRTMLRDAQQDAEVARWEAGLFRKEANDNAAVTGYDILSDGRE